MRTPNPNPVQTRNIKVQTDIGADYFEESSRSHTNTNSKRSVDMSDIRDRGKRVGGGGRIAKAGRLGQKSVNNTSTL